MPTPIQLLASQVIGTVEAVAPHEILVSLTVDAPQATALNAGQPQRFPRINGWVLVPSEVGYLVGAISWIGVDRAPTPGESRHADQALIELPFPRRRMRVTPLGTLRWRGADSEPDLVRGIISYPSVGESVVIPSIKQTLAISRGDKHGRVEIGTSPLAGDSPVVVDPDKLFGRHLAILGNTGSGKSCTVAGLVRWSMEAAVSAADPIDVALETGVPNARFIVLDPNGEYTNAFVDLPNTEQINIAVDPQEDQQGVPFAVPAWMWNSDEWAAVLSARPGVQRPVLHEALRALRSGNLGATSSQAAANRLVSGYHTRIAQMASAGVAGFQGFLGSKNFGSTLINCVSDLEAADVAHLEPHVGVLVSTLQEVASSRHWESGQKSGFNDFANVDAQRVMTALDTVVANLPEGSAQSSSTGVDAPVRFDPAALADYIEFLMGDPRFSGNAQHIAPMAVRLRSLLSDERIGPVILGETSESLLDWLDTFLGDSTGGRIAVVNLSLVPTEVLHVCVAVVGRLIFEALQRYKKKMGFELPTVFVLEEAHTFISNHPVDLDAPTPRYMCRSVFERIAREGRKFGLSLVLSSQRPSELSPTVLAQCNSFILHRLVNDTDQLLVKRLVPDALADLLDELPSLPSRQAILLGWATMLPTLVDIRELPRDQQPRSYDPEFWDVWRGVAPRSRDWTAVVGDWIGDTQRESGGERGSPP
jgi:DNA helicase HerA-like ATPase